MKKYFCPICGNRLNPKIHYKPEELGKTSEEVATLQKKLLEELLKSIYVEDKLTGKKLYLDSICDVVGKR